MVNSYASPISWCCDCPSSGSLIFGQQIVHINEGKGKLALFYSANNVLVTPLLFIFIFLLLHNFIIFLPQFFYSLVHNFIILIFSLLLLLISIVFRPPPSPPPHFYCFPSTTTTATFLLFSFHHQIKKNCC